MQNEIQPEERKYPKVYQDNEMKNADSDSEVLDNPSDASSDDESTIVGHGTDFVVFSEEEKWPRSRTIGALKYFGVKE